MSDMGYHYSGLKLLDYNWKVADERFEAPVSSVFTNYLNH